MSHFSYYQDTLDSLHSVGWLVVVRQLKSRAGNAYWPCNGAVGPNDSYRTRLEKSGLASRPGSAVPDYTAAS